MDNAIAMTIYLRGDVTLPDGQKELHLLRFQVKDLDPLSEGKVDGAIEEIRRKCIEKSGGGTCKITIISQEQFNRPWLMEY